MQFLPSWYMVVLKLLVGQLCFLAVTSKKNIFHFFPDITLMDTGHDAVW